ncbi:MAG: hypothetical protein C0172_00870 [Caldisphaera sp.]|uniref:hypothetical protein n=1 Tax=Caldisphaera sp. TaxID=2060322 RepID=UPI000CC56FEA|nr:MAG: hypothetical protein C0202_00305 [Caldisphaera sp.]PMP89158.1 MAG: hypothetical protein C0172_00870 [Caldisphaera sp.]
MACQEKTSEDCKSKWLICKEGLPNELENYLKNFRVLMPNVLLTGLSNDMSKVYYLFYTNRGSGFFVEMDNVSFNFSDCREIIKGDLLTNVPKLIRSDENLRLVEYIIDNIMFPS